MNRAIIGVDLGGTRIRAARFDQDLKALGREETLTAAHEGLEPALRRVMGRVEAVWPENADEVVGIGVSAPGPVNPKTGVIVAPPNLPGWHNVPLRQLIEDRFGRPTYLNNDGNCAVLAEVRRGVARGYKHVVYITVSTGIGGGIISHGRLIVGAHGLGSEVGHLVLSPEAGLGGSIEKMGAGPAIAREAVLRLEAGAHSKIRDAVGGDLSQVTARVVGEAAAAGDPLGIELIARTGRIVGILIANLMHLLNPEIFIIGGGVTNAGDLLLEPMKQAVRAFAIDESYWRDVPIVRASLGDDVGLIGAAALVQMANEKPAAE
jgi:glucokinase